MTMPAGSLVSRYLLWVLLLVSPLAQALELPPLTGRVVDGADLLSPAQEQALIEKLAALEQTKGDQLVVVTIESLQGTSIEDFGVQLGRAWGIGQEKNNNGALLIVAPNERRVRIEVGYGLEGDITDAQSGIIIREHILPRFKQGDFAEGIQAGIDAILKVLTDGPLESRAAADASDLSGEDLEDGWSLAFFAFPFAMFLKSLLGRVLGGLAGGLLIGVVVFFATSILWIAAVAGVLGGLFVFAADSTGGGGGYTGGGSAGGRFSGGGFGGGFSGGGGSFGGGGASGSW